MNDEILQALQTPPDYSQAFESAMKHLCMALSDYLGQKLHHDTDMNYSAAQSISLFLNEAFYSVSPDSSEGLYDVAILISSKGKYFTFRCKRKLNKQKRDVSYQRASWVILDNSEIPAPVREYYQRITSFLENAGYKLLPESILNTQVEGHFTEMDNMPATVFQVLFSELY